MRPWFASRELADDAAHPGEQVRAGPQNRRTSQGEGGQEWNGVAVHRPGQTVQAVPAEPGLPVDDRLEHDKRERARGEEECGSYGDRTDRDRRRCGYGSRLEPLRSLTASEASQTTVTAVRTASRDGDRCDRPSGGAACHGREVAAVGREARLQRVCERPSGQGDDKCRRCPTRPAGDRVAACGSCDLQRERGGEHVSVDLRLQEQPPGTRHGHEHADGELAGRRGCSGHLRGPDDARASGRAGAADVGVEVVERAGAEEDRVRQCAVPGAEDRGRAIVAPSPWR